MNFNVNFFKLKIQIILWLYLKIYLSIINYYAGQVLADKNSNKFTN